MEDNRKLLANDKEVFACTKCGIEKPLASFYQKGHRHDSQCKSCILLKKKAIRKMQRLAQKAKRNRSKNLFEFKGLQIFESQCESISEENSLYDLLVSLVNEVLI